jgi:hypothetical protein
MLEKIEYSNFTPFKKTGSIFAKGNSTPIPKAAVLTHDKIDIDFSKLVSKTSLATKPPSKAPAPANSSRSMIDDFTMESPAKLALRDLSLHKMKFPKANELYH